jgi:hypothetical protein
VETEHLTKALLEQSDSLVKRILEKAGADASDALRATTRFIERQPRVSGTATQVLGRNLEALVDAARRARDEAGDECVRDTRCACACACAALHVRTCIASASQESSLTCFCALLSVCCSVRFVSSEHLLLALAKDTRFGSGSRRSAKREPCTQCALPHKRTQR